MSWHDGSVFYRALAESFKENSPDGDKEVIKNILVGFIEVLHSLDCCNLYECFGISPESDQALNESGYGEN